jgi:hypothetical protein
MTVIPIGCPPLAARIRICGTLRPVNAFSYFVAYQIAGFLGIPTGRARRRKFFDLARFGA